jgi:hypothetical protein
MTAATRPTPEQLTEWRATFHAYKMIAAAMAEWAADKERGTVLPGNEYWGIEASPSTHRRAKKFLATLGVLSTNDGPYQVA